MTDKPEAAKPAVTGLALLREPFKAHQISKLPKPTPAQTAEVKADFKKGIRCDVCGSWHHPNVVHLDYVGHAALTDRLLDADPAWSWEPMALRDGLPAFDATGALWIKLTVCGVTRLGYGHAGIRPGMDPGAREKEAIGDALRNAAMRFGAALDLWHKGELHVDDDEAKPGPPISAETMAINLLRGCGDRATFKDAWAKNQAGFKQMFDPAAYARVVKVMQECAKALPSEVSAPKAGNTPFDDDTVGDAGDFPGDR